MPPTTTASGGSTGDGGQGSAGNVGTSHLPWHLIPTFKPGETCVNDYTRRLEFLANVWPTEHLAQLAPRACLLTEGAAFQKLVRLDPSKLKVQSLDGIKLVVSTLGGVWGQPKTEHKYERFERAIYSTIQKSDETFSSYVARHEVQYEDMLSLGATLEEMRAYILLRNSGLEAENKKRIIVEAKGTLEYNKITDALQLLGSRFFGEVQGTSKTGNRTKTYDVNFVDEPEEQAHVSEIEEFMTFQSDFSDEQAIEVFLAEGDEDALVMQQFEEALVETLQSDADIAACLNTYVEARKKLQDKARSRGFWSSGKGFNKGKGRGKSKGGFGQFFGQRNRPPLAQRILNSNCKLCGLRGHWKAECPSRDRADSSSKPSTSAFAGVTVVIPEDDDDLGSEQSPTDVPPDDAVAFMATTQETFRCPKVLIKGRCHQSLGNPYHHKISNMKLGSLKERLSKLCRRTPSPPRDPLTVKQVVEEMPLEQAFFASSGSLGIVDLGASLSIIGKQQFEELCQNLPPSVLSTMKESACQVKFRFGNDSSVQGERAVYFPVHKYWIKVVVVPSNTPFLIANSVFRTLGALIDTDRNTIHFKKLGCTLPIQLSARRLYSLDLAELLTRCPPTEVKHAVTVDQQTVCMSTNSEKTIDKQDKGPIKIDRHKDEESYVYRDDSEKGPALASKSSKIISDIHNMVDETSESWSEDPESKSVFAISSEPPQHGLPTESVCPTGRPASAADQEGPGGRRLDDLGRDHGDEVRRSEVSDNRLWQDPCGSHLHGHADRTEVPDLVLPILQGQSECQACQVLEVPSTACGTPRGCQSLHESQECPQSQGKGQGVCDGTDPPAGRTSCTGWTSPTCGRGVSQLGNGAHGRGQSHGDAGAQGSHEQPRIDARSSCRSSEPTGKCSSVKGQDIVSDTIEPCTANAHQQDILLAGWSSLFDSNQFWDPEDITHEGEFIGYNRENNWVATEMWTYMKSQGVHEHSHKGRSIRSDLMEIYCSQDSQLTHSMNRANGDAERFGLKQGDLSTKEGRCRLYDRLLVKQPRHLWMSPRCRAWCRWSQFNMSKSPELAKRILQDRQNDCVHLLLCDALFQYQQWRNPECHAHLEQPDGSQMIYQEELQAVLNQVFRAKCDMCVAGQLKNPFTGEPLKKCTQVLTTSKLMADMLQHLRCNQDHQHGQIEGTIRDPKLGRINLSQYTELYTRQFAQRLARSMISSGRNHETSPKISESACTASNPLSAECETVPKRRRLEDKQPPTEAYLNLYREEKIQKIMEEAKAVAPRVGKMWLTNGPVIQAIQEMFPEYSIVAAELCKGADRRRVPLNSLKPEEAPLRITLGSHRNGVGNFIDQDWEKWSKMSRRQLIRNCSPARLLVTVFARPCQTPMSSESQSEGPVNQTPADQDIQPTKRFKGTDRNTELKVGNPTSEVSTSETLIDCQKGTHHGPAFMRLTPDQRQQLIRMHNNLGHPDAKLLGNVLKDQNWPAEAIEGIKDLHCSSCHETKRPKIARPSNLSNPREFNELITIDGIEWTSAQGTQHFFYHILDSGTNFHIAVRSHQRDSNSVIQLINQHWIQWAGPPQRIMTDSAGEFCSEEFSKFLQSMNILSTVIPAEAHWQLGKCERHGSILQSMLDKYQIEHPITCDQDFDIALSQIISAKNSLSRHRGYSPEILVLGKSRHVPACVSNDPEEPSDWLDPHGTDPEMQWFRDNLARRETARKSFISADHDQRLRRAYLRRSRPSREIHQPGDLVMYWRNGKGSQDGHWHGPGQVIIQEGSQVVWISHLSRLYRCAPEQVRSLSQRELSNVDPNRDNNPAAALDFSNRGTGVFQYQDLSQQNIPNGEIPETIVPTGTSGVHDVNPNPAVGGQSEEEQPDSEPGNPDQTSAIDVPIPQDGFSEEGETEEDNFFTQVFDHWTIEGDLVIRHHIELRNRMFCPTNVTDCPIDVSRLSFDRETIVQPLHGESWSINDQWNQVQSQRILPLPWTGMTKFRIVTKTENVQPSKKRFDQSQGYELVLFMDYDEITDCSRKGVDDQIAFLASAAKRQRAEVKEKTLTLEDKKLFLAAKQKEISSWLSTETVRRIARSQIPEEQILRSRWVLTWKPLDQTGQANENDHQYKAKARLVILGFEDPHIETLSRDAPTMGKDSRMLILQYAASAKWSIHSFDIQTAFLRGSRKDGRILGMEPPEEMRQQMKLKPWECCELLKSAYGLVNAPLLWYEELKSSLLQLGFVVSPLDPCVFVLPNKQTKSIHGLVGVHVDDGLAAGDDHFRQCIQQLESKFPFGSKKEGSFQFTGIRIQQKVDGSIELDQTKYIEDIPAIDVSRDRRKNPQLEVTSEERQSLRGLIGSLQYAASNTRPDISAKLSFLQAKITTAKVQELMDANKLLQEAKLHKDTKIVIKSIPLPDLRFVSFSDASFATRANSQSQKGCLLMATSKQIGQWQSSDASPLVWYSKKISRVVASTLASEAYAMSGAVDLLSWVRIHWSWLCNPHERWKTPEVCLKECPEAYSVVDCKSLYDLIEKTTIPTCQEYRTMLEALIIKDRIKEGIVVKWVHSAAQLADSLTKCMDNTVLRQFLAAGRCIIHDVDEILKVRADNRARKQWQQQQCS